MTGQYLDKYFYFTHPISLNKPYCKFNIYQILTEKTIKNFSIIQLFPLSKNDHDCKQIAAWEERWRAKSKGRQGYGL